MVDCDYPRTCDDSLITAIEKFRPEFAQRDNLRSALRHCGTNVYFATVPKDICDMIMDFVPDLRVRDLSHIMSEARQNRDKLMSTLSTVARNHLNKLQQKSTNELLYSAYGSYIIITEIKSDTTRAINVLDTRHDNMNDDKYIMPYEPMRYNLGEILQNYHSVCILPCGLICFAPSPLDHDVRYVIVDPNNNTQTFVQPFFLKVGDCVNDVGEIISVNLPDLYFSRMNPTMRDKYNEHNEKLFTHDSHIQKIIQ
jgi:hypothetical protein